MGRTWTRVPARRSPDKGEVTCPEQPEGACGPLPWFPPVGGSPCCDLGPWARGVGEQVPPGQPEATLQAFPWHYAKATLRFLLTQK